MHTNFHKLFFPSTEAIAVQGPSAFAQELTKLFQSVIDYKNKLIASGDTKDLVQKVLRFHQTSVSKQISIIFKHTGLTVSRFESSTYPDCGFACVIECGSGMTGAWIQNTAVAGYSGERPDLTNIGTIEVATKALQDISAAIDKSTGKLLTSSFMLGTRTLPLQCQIYFCPFTAYLMHESVSTENKVLTAEEIAAIMLHEIGHNLSTFEHAADLIVQHTKMLDKIDVRVDASTSPANISKYMNMLASTLRTASTHLDSDQQNVANDVAAVAETIAELPKQSSVFARIAAVFLALTDCVTHLITNIFKSIIITVKRHAFANADRLDAVLETYKSKQSDLMTVYGNKALCERYADEYTARHGYARYLISGLSKLHNAVYPGLAVAAVIESSVVYHIYKFHDTLYKLMTVHDETGFGTYETQNKRVESLMQDVLKTMKLKVSPEFMDFLIADYEATQVAYKKALEARSMGTKLIYLRTLITNAISAPNLVKLLLTGNIDRKYQQLMDAVKQINSSKLYYLANKLNRLA